MQPHRRRHPDGLRRRDGARLHDRPGNNGAFDAGGRVVSGVLFDRRGLPCRLEVPDMAGGTRRLGQRGQSKKRFRIMIIFELGVRARASFRGLVRLGGGFRAPVGSADGPLPGLRRRERRARSVGEGACGRSVDRRGPRRIRPPRPRRRRRSLPASRPSSSRSCARSCATPRTSGRGFPRKRARSITTKRPRARSAARRRSEESEALADEGIDVATLPDFLLRDTH